jgi:chemotaxis protein CheX
MISGHSMNQLSGAGYICDITPPTIIRGSNVHVSTLGIPALVIPLKIPDIGELEINVSLQERHQAKVA